MGRWEPNADGRLREAAMALFVERGYEQTTVADIAARVGLTPRTFFRYFADKREVLFDGSEELQAQLLSALEQAPADETPMTLIERVFDAAAAMLGHHHDYATARHAVISSHVELRERELVKLATLALVLADALRRRGVPDPEAGLSAEAGMAVFRVAYKRWVAADNQRSLPDLVRETFAQLRDVAATI